MKRIKLLRYFLAVILLFLAVPFPAGAGPYDSAGAGVLRSTLANGMRVVIVRNTLAPVAAIQMNYLAGSNESPEGFPGMAHALEHMMFRGSPGLSAEQLANIMAYVGGDFNAVTRQTVTQYLFSVPKDDLDVALNIEAVRMRGIDSTQELWVLERGAIEQEVAEDLSSPEYILSARVLEGLFRGTPYAHDPLGTRQSFRNTSAAMLRDFYGRWYAPNNAILVVAGDVDPPGTMAKIEKLFGPIPSRPVPARPAVRLQPLQPASIAIDTDLPYGLAVVAYRLPGLESPDYAAGLILADVLDSKRGRLYALVTQGRALSTTFDGGVLPKSSYGYASAAFPYGGDGPALAAAIKDIIAGYVRDGVPADLVEAARRREIADAEFQSNSIAGLADAWSQALAEEGRSSPYEDIEAVRKVTVEDVNRVLRQYLVNETAVTAVLVPSPSGKKAAAKSYGARESFAPREAKVVEIPAWARSAAKPPGVPVARARPEVHTLGNGLRLIIQTADVSNTVSLYGQIRNLEEPEGKEGVGEVLGSLFTYGTESLDLAAFQKAQDDIGAEIVAGMNFSVKALSEYFERGLELLAGNLLSPALPEEAFKVVQAEIAGSLGGKLKSPAYYSQRALKEALLPEGDPALRQALPETVNGLTLGDVKSYYRMAFRPDTTTIVVVGRIAPHRAKALVEKYFGAWKAEGPPPGTELPVFPLNRPASVMIPDRDKVHDQVVLAETIAMPRSHPDYYRLQLANSVLSGAFYATRLYRDLREKTGLVYTVESFIEAKKNRTMFGVYFACDPPNVPRAKALVENNLREMQTVPVSPDELQRAKTLLIKQVMLAESGVESIAGGLLSRALEGLPLDEQYSAAGQFLAATPEQVRDAFAKWIRPADLVQVTVGQPPE